jgi:hypothetical protein
MRRWEERQKERPWGRVATPGTSAKTSLARTLPLPRCSNDAQAVCAGLVRVRPPPVIRHTLIHLLERALQPHLHQRTADVPILSHVPTRDAVYFRLSAYRPRRPFGPKIWLTCAGIRVALNSQFLCVRFSLSCLKQYADLVCQTALYQSTFSTPDPQRIGPCASRRRAIVAPLYQTAPEMIPFATAPIPLRCA